MLNKDFIEYSNLTLFNRETTSSELESFALEFIKQAYGEPNA
ncbi:hypothetical protein J2Y86_000899 [Pseudomonas migulae]|nr:hypothetical protein [Pseudomonas migulae]